MQSSLGSRIVLQFNYHIVSKYALFVYIGMQILHERVAAL
jgi:hypothetical protein